MNDWKFWFIIFLTGILLWLLLGCNAQNIEYIKFDGDKKSEQIRMGKANFLYWFGMKDFSVDTDKLDVIVGSMQEHPDPNSIETLKPLLFELLKGL